MRDAMKDANGKDRVLYMIIVSFFLSCSVRLDVMDGNSQ